MRSVKTEMMVGIFAIIAITVLSLMTFKVGKFSLGSKEGLLLYAYFKNTAGLEEKTRVKIAGVDAGIVERIELVGGKARVTIRLNKGITIHGDSEAYIKATGLLGDKYIELTYGSATPDLKSGDTLAKANDMADIDELVRKLTSISDDLGGFVRELNNDEFKKNLTATINNLEEITHAMKGTISSNREKIDEIIERIRSISQNLDEMVATNKAPFTNTIDNLQAITSNFRSETPQLIADLKAAATELRDVMDKAGPKLENISANADKAFKDIASIANKVDSGEGTIGKLINDDSLYNSVSKMTGSLSNTLSAIDRFRTFIQFSGDYLSGASDTKGDFKVTLMPNPEKYYIVGVTTDPIAKSARTITIINGGAPTVEDKVEEKFEITAQFVRRFKDTALRIGLTENTFGLGADQHFMKDRIIVSLDAWDFNNKEYLASQPHVKAGANLYATDHLFVSGGYDNIFNKVHRGVYVGGGVRFEDEDFKYIFSSAPKLSAQ